MKKKVLFILPTLHAGGAENYALRFIKYCGSERFRWHVLSPNMQRGDLHDDFEAVGGILHYQSLGYFSISKAVRFWQFCRVEKFDAICTFTGNFGGLSLLIARLAGIPKRIAWHRRSSNAFAQSFYKNAYNGLVNKLLRQHATHILSNSSTALQYFHGAIWEWDKRFRVIPNGLDAASFDIPSSQEQARKALGLPLSAFIVGHVGRYDPAKNHETIFQVAAALKNRQAALKFLFCGKGTDSQAFQQKLHQHGIQDVCIGLGLSQAVPLVYRSMDVFYFPSVTEGQPNALIEAMISGLPVIASNIPAIIEVLPPHLHPFTHAPKEQATVVHLIEALMDKRMDVSWLTAQDWAKKEFDQDQNFGAFLQLLLN